MQSSFSSISITPRTQGKANFNFGKNSDSVENNFKSSVQSMLQTLTEMSSLFGCDLKEEERKQQIPSASIGLENTMILLAEACQQLHVVKGIDRVIFQLPYEAVKPSEYPEHPISSLCQKPLNMPLPNDVSLRPCTQRFGINAESMQPETVGYLMDVKNLHFVEKEIFIEAFAFLKSESLLSAENYLALREKNNGQVDESPNNAVMVDFFPRGIRVDPKGAGDLSKIKKENNSDQPAVHTLVLWKKKDNEIVLIDPSNHSFSLHIALHIKNTFPDLPYKIEPLNVKGGVIYSPGDAPQPRHVDYLDGKPFPRDCIDISAKIAFELNERQLKGDKLDDIAQNAIARISNVTPVKSSNNEGRKFPDYINNTYIREMQSSHAQHRDNAYEYLALSEHKPKLNIPKLEIDKTVVTIPWLIEKRKKQDDNQKGESQKAQQALKLPQNGRKKADPSGKAKDQTTA